jgi:hypothetical protein
LLSTSASHRVKRKEWAKPGRDGFSLITVKPALRVLPGGVQGRGNCFENISRRAPPSFKKPTLVCRQSVQGAVWTGGRDVDDRECARATMGTVLL